jgi:hypothetical protein
MRNLSLVIIALTIILIGISSKVPKEESVALKQPRSPPGASFKVSCNVCHSEKGWVIDKEIYSFNHDLTEMPLVGQHAKIDCKMCHPTLVFSETKKECEGCHTDVHESTVGKDCNRCHTPHSWLVNNITKIHQQSRFPLVGVHATVDCYQCHKSETFRRFDVLGTECYSCHIEDYAATTQPNHSSVGYSTQCNDCHTVFSKEWKGAGFNHSFFPLTQGHALIRCDQCHSSGAPVSISRECISCHQADYNASTSPNHQNANFSTNCTICHSTAPGWKPATFDHSRFPLTQGHDIDDCSKCHVNGNYTNTPNDCVSCHQSDYNNTTNPAHTALNFSTNCTECHTTNPGWNPASYKQHDALSFPIYSGKHKGEWTSCTDCHSNTANYKVFSCIDCHEHNKTSMDNAHRGENGYSYNSIACLNCHPRGSGD